MGRVIEMLQALAKRLASYRKSAWSLEDYPIRILHREPDPRFETSRLQEIPWSAQIINWWQMGGHGSTRAEALENLALNFARYRSSHETLPRPGTGAPLEFAGAGVIDQHRALARDFMERIFNLNLDECFISDESSLWDFHGEETNDAYNRRIALIYRVDVSDLEDAKLGKILERIASERGAG
jgi:hypothetical protein